MYLNIRSVLASVYEKHHVFKHISIHHRVISKVVITKVTIVVKTKKRSCCKHEENRWDIASTHTGRVREADPELPSRRSQEGHSSEKDCRQIDLDGVDLHLSVMGSLHKTHGCRIYVIITDVSPNSCASSPLIMETRYQKAKFTHSIKKGRGRERYRILDAIAPVALLIYF